MISIKKMSVLFLIFVLFALSPAGSALARDKIITAVYTEWFPYTYTKDGNPKGFEIDIFKAVMEKNGYKVKFIAYPWKRCLLSLNSGEADALVSMLKTPEREDSFYFPEENISVSKTVLFASTDSDFVYGGTLESLKGKSVGVVDGFSYGDDFDQADYFIKEMAVNTEILIMKLLHKRSDLAAENMTVVKANARNMGMDGKIKFFEPPIHSRKLYAVFSKKNARLDLCREFSKALSEFKKSGPYLKILEEYHINVVDMK